MTTKSLYFILAGTLLVTCASVIPKLAQQDVVKGKVLYPDLTLEQLISGRTTYINHCGSCHQLYIPSKLAKEKWNKHLLPMSKLSGLDSQSTGKLVRYINVVILTDTTGLSTGAAKR